MKKILFLLLFLLSVGLNAQNKIEITESDYSNTSVEMADQFRKDGKIYVVIAIFSVILGGFITYTIWIDRKVKKLEKKIVHLQNVDE